MAIPQVHIVGDYLCFIPAYDLSTSNVVRQVIRGDQQDIMPDIDFFLPVASMKLQPLSIVKHDDVSRTRMTEVLTALANQTPLYFHSLLRGKLHPAITEHYFGNLSVIEVINSLVAVATGVDCHSYVLKEFNPIEVPICPKHEQQLQSFGQSSVDICNQCMRV